MALKVVEGKEWEMERGEGAGGPMHSIRRMTKESTNCLKSSVSSCTQTFAATIAKLVESLLGDGGGANQEEVEKKTGHVRLLLDCSRLCFRVETQGFGVDPEVLQNNEAFKRLTHFAVISLVTRPTGSLESKELLWCGGDLIGCRQSRHILHSYCTRIVVKDLLVKIPVRRMMLLDLPASKHLAQLRSLLLPSILCNRGLSFSITSWTDSKKVFVTRQNSSVPLALASTFGLEQSNLVRIDVQTAMAMMGEVCLYFLRDWRTQQKTLFEHVLVNDREVVACDRVANRLRGFAHKLFRGDPREKNRRRGGKFSFLLQIKSAEHHKQQTQERGAMKMLQDDSDAMDTLLDQLIEAVQKWEMEAEMEREKRKEKKAALVQGGREGGLQKLAFKISKKRKITKESFTFLRLPCPCCQPDSELQQYPAAPAHGKMQRKEGEGKVPDFLCKVVENDDCRVDVRHLDDLSFYGKDLLPGTISREMLRSCVTIGQVDTKFIACLCGSALVLFDQHAADERIKLEQLTASTLANLKGGLNSFRCDPPLQFRATFEELDIVETYMDRLTSWGWRVEISSPFQEKEKEREKENVVLISGVPCIDGRNLTLPDLREYIQQLGETCGSRSMPKAVNYVLGSRSCRSAIKFGDQLTWEECSRLVDGIGKAKMPFQCAHGRPTCAPLVNLAKLGVIEETIAQRKTNQTKRRRIDLRKLRKKCRLPKTSES